MASTRRNRGISYADASIVQHHRYCNTSAGGPIYRKIRDAYPEDTETARSSVAAERAILRLALISILNLEFVGAEYEGRLLPLRIVVDFGHHEIFIMRAVRLVNMYETPDAIKSLYEQFQIGAQSYLNPQRWRKT
ncbi:Protein of unknown function [Pyronema omphalodes CBS 100304]|uniref:Uncharacterized protein n=1 Tax=Pyronema omphalodes (strain CBS 100304) TaxID=1076935 RepID=U4LKR4_PYROM|nr:Protein of unknown function [Pyronema omphalodes CBS 100304]